MREHSVNFVSLHTCPALGNINCMEGGWDMASKFTKFQKFRPDHLGTQPRKSDSNNGKKMNTKGNDHPDYIPPKGK
ncbi:small acid-soluble spore N family protein [Evansella cellulosilytica DSM 2522]|uniref:Small, acid-soluble spore protein N n=1 Tax=Evansella cellulosilytica (strain ATCC 21833 / DSM 2522 / FERM P-1141 / JCM 9156 / N-4) TaxID=649639 RepID=E6U1P4_EVAC2|nr:small acid-soluble spore N family protein [Evansella cellulosilytica DSM 2522]